MKKSLKSSQYYGVSKIKETGRYKVYIIVNGKLLVRKNFINELDAAIFYDEYVRSHKLNKRLNFPDPEPYNPIPNTRLIRLTKGKFAVVDEEDYEWLNQYNWSALRFGELWYAYGYMEVNGEQKSCKMHRAVMGFPEFDLDHADNDGLHNYKTNLRECTDSQNQGNRRSFKKSSSIYTGVCWDKRVGQWKSAVKINGKSIHLGYFDLEIDAAKVRDIKAKEVFGDFAKLNFPDQQAAVDFNN